MRLRVVLFALAAAGSLAALALAICAGWQVGLGVYLLVTAGLVAVLLRGLRHEPTPRPVARRGMDLVKLSQPAPWLAMRRGLR